MRPLRVSHAARPAAQRRALACALATGRRSCSGTGFGATERDARFHAPPSLGTLSHDRSGRVGRRRRPSAPMPSGAARHRRLHRRDASPPGHRAVLRLGSLAGTDVQAGSLRWLVTTTNPLGYRVTMSNAGTAPLMRSSCGLDRRHAVDLRGAPASSVVDDATHFGVAMGDPRADDEAAVPAAVGTPGGQQGELFRGIPASRRRRRRAPDAADQRSLHGDVRRCIRRQPGSASGAYSGTIR